MAESVCKLDPPALFFPTPHNYITENALLLHSYLPKTTGQEALTGKPEDNVLVFKIKATTPGRYIVRPRQGLLFPETTRHVHISLRPVDSAEQDELRDKFVLEVRRVGSAKLFAEIMKLLEDPAHNDLEQRDQALHLEKMVQDKLKTLFSASPVLADNISVPCFFNNVEWRKNGVVSDDPHTHAGQITLKGDGKSQPQQFAATLRFVHPLDHNEAEEIGGVNTSTVSADASASPSTSQLLIRKGQQLQQEVDRKRAEESSFKAELVALQNQTKQLQEECEAVIKASSRNETKLKTLQEESIKNRERHGSVQLVSIPLPVMFMLVFMTFILSFFFRRSFTGAALSAVYDSAPN